MKIIDSLSKSFTGRRAQKLTVNKMLENSHKAFGKAWKKVAEQSGISDRTLRRIRAGGKPSKETQRKLDALARRAEVRKAAVQPRTAKRLQQARDQGAKLRINGSQGPRGKGADDYKRPRTVEFVLPGEAFGDLIDAYEAGDDEQMQQIMSNHVADYGWDNWTPPGGWDFGSIDEFDFDPH